MTDQEKLTMVKIENLNIQKMITIYHLIDKPFNSDLFDEELRRVMIKKYHTNVTLK